MWRSMEVEKVPMCVVVSKFHKEHTENVNEFVVSWMLPVLFYNPLFSFSPALRMDHCASGIPASSETTTAHRRSHKLENGHIRARPGTLVVSSMFTFHILNNISSVCWFFYIHRHSDNERSIGWFCRVTAYSSGIQMWTRKQKLKQTLWEGSFVSLLSFCVYSIFLLVDAMMSLYL